MEKFFKKFLNSKKYKKIVFMVKLIFFLITYAVKKLRFGMEDFYA